MATHIDALGFKVLMAEAIELADPVAIATDQHATQQAIIACCGQAGPHAFAIAAVSALASVFAAYPGSRDHVTRAVTDVIANNALAAAANS